MKAKVITTTDADGLRTRDHRTYTLGGLDFQGLTSAFPDEDLTFAHQAAVDARCRLMADEYAEKGEVTFYASERGADGAWTAKKGNILEALAEPGAISKAGLFAFGLARARGSYCADVLSRQLLGERPSPSADEARTWMPYAPDEYLEETALCAASSVCAAEALAVEMRRRFPEATLFASELVCFHDGLRYACTSDIIYKDPERGFIPVELKTSTTRKFKRSWMMQLALQAKVTGYVDGRKIVHVPLIDQAKDPCGLVVLVTPVEYGIRYCDDLSAAAHVASGYIDLALREREVPMPKDKFAWTKVAR